MKQTFENVESNVNQLVQKQKIELEKKDKVIEELKK